MIVLPRISIKRRIQTQVSAVARCFAALPRVQFVELAFKEWLLLAQSRRSDKFRDVTEVKVGHQRAATLLTTPDYGSRKEAGAHQHLMPAGYDPFDQAQRLNDLTGVKAGQRTRQTCTAAGHLYRTAFQGSAARGRA